MQEKALGGPIDALADEQEDVEEAVGLAWKCDNITVAKPGDTDP